MNYIISLFIFLHSNHNFLHSNSSEESTSMAHKSSESYKKKKTILWDAHHAKKNICFS